MTTRKTQHWTYALFALGLAMAGCSDDGGDPAPSGGPSLNLDSGVGQLDSGVTPQADAGTDAGGSTGPNGCFQGKPTTNTQLLNACAQGCQPFDNATKLPGYQPGKLPPL